MNDLWTRGQLKEIGRDECFELLESTSVGRIGYCTIRGAVILPVNHAVIGCEIVVRLEPSGQTARYLRDNAPGPDLSFEVDQFDDDTRSGWSVLVTGTARAVDAEGLLRVTDRPVPWPSGGFWEYVRIHPNRVTGRRLVPS
jgi:nitroimidazol reductase NimA-like FMN-containing flavoprotein (pyridoxamine 5'-phosphate oxidase superfamily)